MVRRDQESDGQDISAQDIGAQDIVVSLARQLRERELLDRVRDVLAREFDIDRLCQAVVKATREAFGYDRIVVSMVNNDFVVPQFYLGFDQNLPHVHISQGIIGRIVRQAKAELITDVRIDEDYIKVNTEVVAQVCVPLLYQDTVVGVFSVESNEANLTERDLELMSALGDYVSIALERAHIYNQMKTNEAQLAKQNAELRQKREELISLNTALERVNRLKSEFLATMSHELRTPLTSIIGFSELLNEEIFGSLNDKQKQYVLDIHDSGSHLLSLINDVLDLSKIEAGKMELHLELLDLGHLLETLVGSMLAKAKQAGLTLSFERPASLDYLTADARKIKQVVYNLLSNAIKFTPRGGGVSIRLEEHEDEVYVFVSDTGVGISPENMAKLFQAFSQVDASLSRRHEGTGLGLALSHSLVALHGGRMWVESTVNEGSIFAFSLPNQPSGLMFQVDHFRALDDSKMLALVIEDDDKVAALFETYLEQEGFAVIRARNGYQGLILARQHQPSLIILDILMPVMGGWRFLESLNSETSLVQIPIVITSVLAADSDKGYALGASAVLSKPIDREVFVAAVDQVLEEKLGQQQVLVVDDDPRAVELISQQLLRLGHEVSVAYSGEEALTSCQQKSPDLMVLDLMMPEMTGFDVLEALREQELRDFPVMVLTSKMLTQEDRLRLNGQVEGIAQKSGFGLAQFRREIRRLIKA